MPIETGQYCVHCADESGAIKPFDERFESMISWALKQSPDLDRATAEARTLEFMGKLPAWRQHPEYLARIKARNN